MLVFKKLIDYLFFLIREVIIQLQKIYIINTLYQDQKQISTTLKLMAEIFIMKQLMTQLNNITKFENKFENNNFENKFKNV